MHIRVLLLGRTCFAHISVFQSGLALAPSTNNPDPPFLALGSGFKKEKDMTERLIARGLDKAHKNTTDFLTITSGRSLSEIGLRSSCLRKLMLGILEFTARRCPCLLCPRGVPSWPRIEKQSLRHPGHSCGIRGRPLLTSVLLHLWEARGGIGHNGSCGGQANAHKTYTHRYEGTMDTLHTLFCWLHWLLTFSLCNGS